MIRIGGIKSALDRDLHGAGARLSKDLRSEISARLRKQIFLKRRLRLQEESFSPGREFQPGFGLEISAQSNGLKKLRRVQISARAEI